MEEALRSVSSVPTDAWERGPLLPSFRTPLCPRASLPLHYPPSSRPLSCTPRGCTRTSPGLEAALLCSGPALGAHGDPMTFSQRVRGPELTWPLRPQCPGIASHVGSRPWPREGWGTGALSEEVAEWEGSRAQGLKAGGAVRAPLGHHVTAGFVATGPNSPACSCPVPGGFSRASLWAAVWPIGDPVPAGCSPTLLTLFPG